MKNKKLKYVARKGSDLKLDDFKDAKRSIRFKKSVNFINSLFFKNPFRTFSGLILLVALPITLYITLKTDILEIRSKAGGSQMKLEGADITELNAGRDYDFSFKVEGEGIENIQFLDVRTPKWLTKGNEVEGSLDNGSTVYKMISYFGTTVENSSDRFALLARSTSTELVSSCSGCDKDAKNLYSFYELNLTTNNCESTDVYARNPVGHMDTYNENSYCQHFESECLVPSTWKQFDSQEECLGSKNEPAFNKSIEDKIYRFEVDCDGSIENDPALLDELLGATDLDGDIVRFTAESRGDFVSIKQDNIEKIVKGVSGVQGKNYSESEYSVVLEGEIGSSFIGRTTTVKVDACDSIGNCSEEAFEVSAIKRGVCRFVLPVTGALANVNIIQPEDGAEISGIDNIILTLSGSNTFDVKLDLYNSDCLNEDDFISNIATYQGFSLDGERGLAVSFDSRLYDDNEYCIKVFARDATLDTSDANWEDCISRHFSIRNDNEDPTFTTTPPDGNLTTGDSYEYSFNATDSDGDTLTYDVIGSPSWINVGNNTLSGTTSVPGSYNFTIFVDDGRGGYATQQISIVVLPPENQPTNIDITNPENRAVVGGSENTISWEVSDNEGVAQVQLFYSTDRQEWISIRSFDSGTTEANWDVSDLPNGVYYLMIVVTDSSSQGVESSYIWGPIYIANDTVTEDEDTDQDEDSSDEDDDGEIIGEDTSMPAINNMTPEPDSEIDSRKPLISASFHASNNANIIAQEVEVFLNDEKINSICDISESEVLCQIQDELEYGEHKVRINVIDSNEKTMTEEWYFTIVELEDSTEEATDETEDDSSEEYITIPFIEARIEKVALIISSALCVVALLLILIPWLIYYIWNKRHSDSGIENTPTYEPSPMASSSQVGNTEQGYNYTQPQSTEPQDVASQNKGYSSGNDVESGSMPHGYSPQEGTSDSAY